MGSTRKYATLYEKVKASIARHPDWPDKRICRAARGSTLSLIRAAREGKYDADPAASVAELASTSPVQALPALPVIPVSAAESELVTLDKVISHYDIASQIRIELAKLPRGKLIPEHVLVRITAGTDRSRFRNAVVRCQKEFDLVRAPLKLSRDDKDSHWYWGHADDIAQAKAWRDS